MDNNSTLEQVLLVLNRSNELLQMIGMAFDSKVAWMGKKNLIILQIINKQINLKKPDVQFFDI